MLNKEVMSFTIAGIPAKRIAASAVTAGIHFQFWYSQLKLSLHCSGYHIASNFQRVYVTINPKQMFIFADV